MGIPETPAVAGGLDEQARNEFWASLALRHTRGLGARSCKRLLACFGSAYAAVRQPERWKEAKVGRDRAEALASGAWRVTAKREWDAARALNGHVLLWTDPRYPAQLRELPDAPVFLYCRGDLTLLSGACLGIVGKRTCSTEGIRAAAALAEGVAAAGMTVVSGLAVGIDRAAHMAAVEQSGGTIAVLGAGLDVDYPKGNRDLRRKIERRGLLLTEYAPGTPPDAGHFPVRNRIISGLSLGVLVVEAELRSGSLITARLALEQNRSVYVLPEKFAPGAASALSEGCRSLLEQGATSVSGPEDILRDLEPQLQGLLRSATDLPERGEAVARTKLPDDPPGLPDLFDSPDLPDLPVLSARPDQVAPEEPAEEASLVERRILDALRSAPLGADDVCRILDLSAGDVSAGLIMLEVRGRVHRLADLRYARIRRGEAAVDPEGA